MQTNECKKEKVILLIIMLLTSIFALGCGIKGNGDEPVIKYEFCPGTYTQDAKTVYNMFYYATNQSKASGYIQDSANKEIKGSSFSPAVNATKNGWVSDGFYYDDKSIYSKGNYTLCFDVSGKSYRKTTNINWENLPKWKEIPRIDYDSSNHTVSVAKIPDITETPYKRQYIIKTYVAGLTTSKLYGQSEILKEGKGSFISYSLGNPHTSESIRLVPVLVCELLSKDNRIVGTLFCPGSAFNY